MPSPSSPAERVQLREATEMRELAIEAGIPPVLAHQLRRAGGERILPDEMLGLVGYLVFNHGGYRDSLDGLADTDQELSELLLEHYPEAVTAMVGDEGEREVVLALWENSQKPSLEAGAPAPRV